MTPSSVVQPAPGILVGPLVVGEGVTVEESAQVIGVSWVPQPDQCLGVELVRPLSGQAQRRADLAIGGGCMPLQAIVGDDDVRQSWRQAIHHRQEGPLNGFPFPDDGGVWCFP